MKKFYFKTLVIATLINVIIAQCDSNNWQDYYPNLQGCQLENADLSGQNMWFGNFTGANLTNANLSNAQIGDAVFENAQMQGADLSNSDQGGAMGPNFNNADLQNANFTGSSIASTFVNANLAYANFDNIGNGWYLDISGACIEGIDQQSLIQFDYPVQGTPIADGCATVEPINWDDCTNVINNQCNSSSWQEHYPNLQGCQLEDANLSGQNMWFGNFTCANLTNANLSNAQIGDAVFENAQMQGADLSNSDRILFDLQNANFTGSSIASTFVNANLAYANFDNIGNGWYLDISGACIEGIDQQSLIAQFDYPVQGTPIADGCATVESNVDDDNGIFKPETKEDLQTAVDLWTCNVDENDCDKSFYAINIWSYISMGCVFNNRYVISIF